MEGGIRKIVPQLVNNPLVTGSSARRPRHGLGEPSLVLISWTKPVQEPEYETTLALQRGVSLQKKTKPCERCLENGDPEKGSPAWLRKGPSARKSTIALLLPVRWVTALLLCVCLVGRVSRCPLAEGR